ncbi:MAG: hypothetical protein OXN17_07690 [Candidatus Poribacteria bacterium]|nr:hypothetical protein [Candidatus Poribacteria bacterium]MDE0505660.1 hypothetical protein [Candidatus Poribacteria bacterium]
MFVVRLLMRLDIPPQVFNVELVALGLVGFFRLDLDLSQLRHQRRHHLVDCLMNPKINRPLSHERQMPLPSRRNLVVVVEHHLVFHPLVVMVRRLERSVSQIHQWMDILVDRH